MQKIGLHHYLAIACWSGLLLLIGCGKNQPQIELAKPYPTLSLVSQAKLPVKKIANLPEPVVSAKAYYILDLKTSTVLAAKNENQPLYPASTTKMLTAILSRKIYQLDQPVTVVKEAFTQGSTINLQMGEKVLVRDLLAALLINSANDAGFALANHHPFGYQGFVAQLNDLAQQLHLSQTRFTNPTGLDTDGHQSTARDLALIGQELLKDDYLKQLVATKKMLITDQTGKIQHWLNNTNELLGVDARIKGMKTGTTPLANQVLVSYAEVDDQQLIIVVMDSQQRYIDTTKLLDWVMASYQWQTVQELATINS